MPDSPLKDETPEVLDPAEEKKPEETEVEYTEPSSSETSEPKVKLPEPSKRELEALQVSAIESVEVKPDNAEDAPADPDTEITFKPRPREAAWWQKKKVMIPAGIVAMIAVIFAVPFTRYALLGGVVHKDVTVLVQDATRQSAVAGAKVTIGGSSATTDTSGRATVRSVGIGAHDATIEKRFYDTARQSITVDIITPSETTLRLNAQGTIVSVAVKDRVTNLPIEDAVVAGKEVTFGKTSANGIVDVVIPKGQKKAEIRVTSSKHLVLKADVEEKTKDLKLIPSGAVYYLEKQDGRLNVVKANFDGSERKVIVPATGSETDGTTLLVNNPKGSFAALQAKRAPNKPDGLYVIDTKTDTYSVIDEGQLQFTVIGWIGDRLVYQSTRQGDDTWRDKSTVLKSYDATTKKTVVLDENASDMASTSAAAAYETIGAYMLNESSVTYFKVWTATGTKTIPLTGKTSQLITVKADGSGRAVLKSVDATKVSSVGVVMSRPGVAQYELIGASPASKTYGEVSNGSYKDVANADQYTKQYPSYIESPGRSKTVWSQQEGGKTKVMVGDKKGEQVKEIQLEGNFTAYGWSTDDYVMLQKDNAELYIISAGMIREVAPLKIGGYFRTNNESVVGYGGR